MMFFTLAWGVLRKTWKVLLPAVIILGAILYARHALNERLAEEFRAGEKKVQAQWEEAKIVAERQRQDERKRALEHLTAFDLYHQQIERDLAAEARGLANELDEAIKAADAAVAACRAPRGMFAPHRRLSE
jgi:hypothetical protein